MNWINAMENIAAEHADTVRGIRYRLEEIDSTARATERALGSTAPQTQASAAGSRAHATTKVRVTAEVRDFEPDSRPASLATANLRPEPPTLSSLLERYGTGRPMEIALADGYGSMQTLSLSHFSGMSLGTYIEIAFSSRLADRPFPPLQPSEVVLKEYVRSDSPNLNR